MAVSTNDKFKVNRWKRVFVKPERQIGGTLANPPAAAKFAKFIVEISGNSKYIPVNTAAHVNIDSIEIVDYTEGLEDTSLLTLFTDDFITSSKEYLRNKSNDGRTYPHYSEIESYGKMCVVAPVISGRNHITNKKVSSNGTIGAWDNTLSWSLPDWIEHNTDTTTAVQGLNVDDSVLTAYEGGYFENHYGFTNDSAFLTTYDLDARPFTYSKFVEVLSGGTTFSGPLLEITCSGERSHTAAYHHKRAPIRNNYHIPLVLESGQ